MDRGFDLHSLLENLLGQELNEDKNEQWLEYNSTLAKLFGKLKKDTGAETIRQNYRGTGSQKFRRQMWVRWPNGGSMDIWLDDNEVMFGGIVSILPGGQRIEAPKKRIAYDDASPEDIYKAVVANLKNWLKDAESETGTSTATVAKAAKVPATPVANPAKGSTAPSAAIPDPAAAPTGAKANVDSKQRSIYQAALKVKKGDFVLLGYKPPGSSAKEVTYEVTSGPYTSGGSLSWGLLNTQNKAGRGGGSVLHIDKDRSAVDFQVNSSASPVDLLSLKIGETTEAKDDEDEDDEDDEDDEEADDDGEADDEDDDEDEDEDDDEDEDEDDDDEEDDEENDEEEDEEGDEEDESEGEDDEEGDDEDEESDEECEPCNPEGLQLSDSTFSFLNSGRPYVIRRDGEGYSLTGPRGASYRGVRNKHTGIVQFVEKPLDSLTITDRNGIVRIRKY